MSYRPAELRAAIAQVYEQNKPIFLKDVVWNRVDGTKQVYTIQLAPIPKPDVAPTGVCISFLEVTDYKRLQEELEVSNLELTAAYEEAQSSAEELETTNEELQSSAEELETTNEELQSANEEMQTMNEELQSANEELETTNEELRQRSLELTQVTEFMESILSSLPGGVIVVGLDMQVQAWNHLSEDLWGLRMDEVVGKNLMNLEFGLAMEQLYPLVRACLGGNSQREEVALDAINRRGKSIVCRVTCTRVTNGKGKTIGAMLLMTQIN
jgi:two-component system CheB/CheR fusion protein